MWPRLYLDGRGLLCYDKGVRREGGMGCQTHYEIQLPPRPSRYC